MILLQLLYIYIYIYLVYSTPIMYIEMSTFSMSNDIFTIAVLAVLNAKNIYR